MHCTWEESGKETQWSQKLKNYASEIHARRLNAKEVLTPMSGEKFIFSIEDGTVKFSGGDQVLRTSTLILGPPRTRRRTRKSSKENEMDLPQHHFKTHLCMMVKLEISGPFQASICSRGAGLGHPMDPVVSVQKNFSGTKRACKSSWSRRGNQK